MAAYYRFIIGTGTAWVDTYVLEVEEPTTDYGALVDMFIDWMVEKRDPRIMDMENEYEWGDEEDGYETIYEKANPEWKYYSDQFIQGGNCGDVLFHYGEFRIEDISENEINENDVIIKESEVV